MGRSKGRWIFRDLGVVDDFSDSSTFGLSTNFLTGYSRRFWLLPIRSLEKDCFFNSIFIKYHFRWKAVQQSNIWVHFSSDKWSWILVRVLLNLVPCHTFLWHILENTTLSYQYSLYVNIVFVLSLRRLSLIFFFCTIFTTYNTA